MSLKFFNLIAFAAIALFAIAPQPLAQRRALPSPAKSANSAAAPANSFWAAQRILETAIAALKEYIKRAPFNDERVETAKQQLAALEAVRAVADKPVWTQFHASWGDGGDDILLWRVVAVERSEDATRLQIEIRNNHASKQLCFAPFEQNPLVLVGSDGQTVPMLASDQRPNTVEIANENKMERDGDDRRGAWCLHGNQTILINAEFAPLATRVSAGQVNYRDGGAAKPARFQLATRKL